MVFKDGKPSTFYQEYVKEIQAKIVENAALEYGCIWKEHSRPGSTKARTIISDELSSTLNNLQAELESSDLFEDEESRHGVLNRAIPQTLVKQVGLEVLMKRLPEPYQRALFSSWVAAHFVRARSLITFVQSLTCLFRSINMVSQGAMSTFSISHENLHSRSSSGPFVTLGIRFEWYWLAGWQSERTSLAFSITELLCKQTSELRSLLTLKESAFVSSTLLRGNRRGRFSHGLPRRFSYSMLSSIVLPSSHFS